MPVVSAQFLARPYTNLSGYLYSRSRIITSNNLHLNTSFSTSGNSTWHIVSHWVFYRKGSNKVQFLWLIHIAVSKSQHTHTRILVSSYLLLNNTTMGITDNTHIKNNLRCTLYGYLLLVEYRSHVFLLCRERNLSNY